MSPLQLRAIVWEVTHASDGLRGAIHKGDLGPIRCCQAGTACRLYLVEARRRDRARIDAEQEDKRAVALLFILTAMRLGDEHDVLEGLRLLNARGVDTRGLPVGQRFRKAGEARKKSITSERHYVRSGLAARTEERLAEELYNVITDNEVLRRALETDGTRAVASYL